MKEHSSLYVVGITMVATLGGLLFGYDTAVISGAEKSIQAYLINGLGLGTLAHGATISSALIGCILGGMVSGLLASKLGRKNSLLLSAFLFFFSSIGSGWPEAFFFTQGHPTMGLLFMFNFYRIIGGIGVGIASAVVPMYIGEIAPAEMRGRLVSLNQIAIISGMLVVYFVNYGIAHGQTVEWINANMGGKAKVCNFILDHIEALIPRRLGTEAALKEGGAGIELVESLELVDINQDEGFKFASTLLQKNPDINVWIGPDDTVLGVNALLKSKGKKPATDKIYVSGLNGSVAGQDAVSKGTFVRDT